MFRGLVTWCCVAVFCSRGGRRISRTTASASGPAGVGGLSLTVRLLLVSVLLLQPGQRYHYADAASWGHLWPGGGRRDATAAADGQRDVVQLAHDYREPVPTGLFHWSEYGAWTTCTASCGTGVEGRRRICLDERNEEVPSAYCRGFQRQYRLCRIQNCPSSFDLGYRASRCQEMAPMGHRWKPFYPSERDGYSPCTLVCYNEERHRDVRVVERDVPSGTRCAKFRDGSAETGVCIEGLCLSVGCDGYLNSTTYPDRCGVCGGDGSSCALVSDQVISENLQVGYTDILEIPSGATNIRIAETHSIQNYLALTNSEGHYFTNGNLKVDAVISDDFRAVGAWFRYQRRHLFSRKQWEDRESLSSKGPTNETIYLQVLNFIYGSTHRLHYEYVIPLQTSTPEPAEEQFYTDSQPPQVNPTESITRYDAEMSMDTLLEAADVSPPLFPVNMSDIDIKKHSLPEEVGFWEVQAMSRNRTSLPLIISKSNVVRGSDPSRATDLRTADHDVRTNSEYFRNETQMQTLPQERVWSSTSIDGQTEERNVHQRRNGSRVVTFQAPFLEKLFVPESLDSRRTQGEWSREWPDIASMQGPNTQGRILLDRDNIQPSRQVSGSNLREGETAPGHKDESTLVYGPPYRTEDSRHNSSAVEIAAFSSSEKTSTEGFETSTLTMKTTSTSSKVMLTTASEITLGIRIEESPPPEVPPVQDDRPPVIKQHEGDNKVGFESQVPEDMDMSDSEYDQDFSSSDVDNELLYTTMSTPPSSRTSGLGTAASMAVTKITSPTTLPTTNPTTNAAQTTTEEIINTSLPMTMSTTSPQTTSQLTTLMASLPTTVSTTSAPTTMTAAATTSEVATTESLPAYQWRVTATMPCSATCNRGIIRNYAYCVDSEEQQVDDTKCNKKSKPDVIAKECARQPCETRWEVGSWSNCLGDCEASYRFRTVHCWLMMGQGLDTSVPADRCNVTDKPNATIPCTEQNCRPQWIVSDWSTCSTPCGTGRQTRQVSCSEISGCDMTQRPEREQSCNSGPCTWNTSPWSQCSGRCTVQSRRVFCMAERTDQANVRVDDGLCPGQEKPLTTQLCGNGPCQPKLVPQTWGQCEGDCRSAYRRRRIVCLAITRDSRTVMLPDGRCGQDRPVNQQRCVKPDCPQRASPEWMTSIWKPCSATCGSGWQTREVRCLIGGRISNRCDTLSRPQSRRQCTKPPCTQQQVPRNIAVSSGACEDSTTADCNLIVQASLCRYSRYKKTCCRSCANVAGRSGARGRK